MARYIMAIDSGRCMNCKACVIACQQRNNVPYGLSRNWIRESVRPEEKAGFHFQPGACMHCDDPSCVRVCPVGATWKGADGAVEIDPARCIGCGSCIEACPYHARFKNPRTGTADKCDYCRGSGVDAVPACVSVCPTHCRIYGDADDAASEVAQVLAARKNVHIVPEHSGARPTLTYLDATWPELLPEGPVTSSPMDAMPHLAKALTVAGGLVLAALTGTFVRQCISPSPGEEAELAREEQAKAREMAEHAQNSPESQDQGRSQ